jgi:hypothetical protein
MKYQINKHCYVCSNIEDCNCTISWKQYLDVIISINELKQDLENNDLMNESLSRFLEKIQPLLIEAEKETRLE